MIINDTKAIFTIDLFKKRPILKFGVPVLMIVTAIVLLSMTSAFAVSSAESPGEGAPDIDWAKSFGGLDNDMFTSVIAVSDGYVAVGYSYADSFGEGDLADLSAMGNNDAIIVKFDTSGNVQWVKSFGGADDDYFFSVTADSDGYVAVGRSDGGSYGTGNWVGVDRKGDYDAIAVKFDTDGNVMWAKNFGGDGYSSFYSVTAGGNGYVAVGFSSLLSYGTGDLAGVAGKGLDDAIMVKYDFDGSVIWAKNFGGDGDDSFFSVAADSTGYVAVGHSNSTSFGNGDWTGIAGKGGKDAIIVKYDFNGGRIWAKSFGGSGDDTFYSVTADSSGYVAAGVSAPLSFGSGDWAGFTAKGKNDATIVKFTKSGDVDWAKNFGGAGNDFFNCVITDSSGYVAVGGSEASSFGNDDWTGIAGKGGDDAVIVKFDTEGSVVWKKNIGGSSQDNFTSVAAYSSGYVAAGHSNIESFGNGDWIGVPVNGAVDSTIVKLEVVPDEPDEPTEPGSPGSNTMVWVGIAAVVIILTVVAVFVMIRYKTP